MSSERQPTDDDIPVGDLPDVYEYILLARSRGNNNRRAHLSINCRYAHDGYAKKSVKHHPGIKVCRYCLVEDGIVSRTYVPHRGGPGTSWWDETKHDIDVEAAMLEYAPEEGAP